jgi:hypothetical protein
LLRTLGLILVLICPPSDHRIRQYGHSPFLTAETSLLHLDVSIHDFASSTADQIPDNPESNYECSQNVRHGWTEYDDVLQGYEGVLLSEPLGVPDDLFSTGDSYVRCDNPVKYIDPRLLTNPGHESLNCSMPVISQLGLEALAQVTHSQSFSNPILPETQHIPSTAYTEVPSDRQELNLRIYYSPYLPVPLDSSSSQSASPTRSDQTSSDTPEGKIEIVATRARYVCVTCKESFTTERRYRNHVGALGCHTPFDCHDCGRKFKNAKDLRRHRGHNQAASSCPKFKTAGVRANPFACTCSTKTYTRKDSLQRHLSKFARDKPQHHRCKACNHAQCRCS